MADKFKRTGAHKLQSNNIKILKHVFFIRKIQKSYSPKLKTVEEWYTINLDTSALVSNPNIRWECKLMHKLTTLFM